MITLSNGDVFNSKNAIKEHAKKILNKWPKYQSLNNPDRGFIISIFEMHPKYEDHTASGAKVIDVRIEDNIENTKGFHLIFDDGSNVGWSYKTAIDGYTLSPVGKAKKSLRAVIQNQLREAKDWYFAKTGHEKAPCQHSGGMYMRSDIHVDHCAGLPLHKIIDDYCALYNVDLENFEVVDTNNKGLKLPKDKNESIRFYNYHKEVAIVRFLCEHAHQHDRPSDDLYGMPIRELLTGDTRKVSF